MLWRTWQRWYVCPSILYAEPQRTLLWRGIFNGVVIPQSIWTLLKYLMRWLDTWIFTASVRIAEITLSDPPRTWLSARSGLYSHMALAVSMAPIFMIWLMTVMFARLTTWAKHLLECEFLKVSQQQHWKYPHQLILLRIPLLIPASM